MTLSVNYKKRKNSNLFNKLQTNKTIQLDYVQNYAPLFDLFFSLNSTNWNSINLNNQWYICDIKEPKKKNNDNLNIYDCKLKNIDDEDFVRNQQVFIKMAPLLDPFKYLVGKYNHTDTHLFDLPSLEKSSYIHPKIANTNNSSYIDGFFSYLTSKLLNDKHFIHGIDFYGSFLAIKNNYCVNIIDDIDYLVQSDFFNKQKGVLFEVEDYSHLIDNVTPFKPLKPLFISNSLKSNISIKSIDENQFEDIFEDKQQFTLDDIKNIGVDLVDITNSNFFDLSSVSQKSKTLNSDSSCSSRTSHTDSDYENKTSKCSSFENSSQEDASEFDESNMSSIDEDEIINLTFPKFPVNIICMEKCDNTFDDLILHNILTEEEWFSALMQIIMILITYQKVYSFTHNDLHTNNVMYTSTNLKYIYYVYKKKTYKVPTFGKVYKIIDFGRAIYKYNSKIFCSDSFQNGGDASTQYNTEPYFDDSKPRLEPNYSFDLCRLACSIFDYVVDDFEVIKNYPASQNNCTPLVKLIIDWCIDDNGINILYKNNGTERYPDFKLYKMIARHVHNHTPEAQLIRKEFSQYVVSNKNILKGEFIINIDEIM
jgi:hypothetical protein